MAEAVENLPGAGAWAGVDEPPFGVSAEESAEGRLARMLEELGGVISTARDPRDLRLIGIQSIIILVLSVSFLACVGLVIYKEFKKPTVITIVKSAGEVYEINDLSGGQSAAGVSMRPGDITEDEKVQISEALARGIYRINPVTRGDDNRQLIGLMVGATAGEYVTNLKASGVLKRQAEEKWTANWTKMDSSVVEGMPNTVRVLGRQDLVKVVGGRRVEESHTYSLDVLLTLDDAGRDPRNLNTGLRVLKFSIKEIKE